MGMKLIRTSDNTEYKYTLAYLGYASNPEQAELELTYNDAEATVPYKSNAITLKVKRNDLSTAFDIKLTSESTDFSNYYFETT